MLKSLWGRGGEGEDWWLNISLRFHPWICVRKNIKNLTFSLKKLLMFYMDLYEQSIYFSEYLSKLIGKNYFLYRFIFAVIININIYNHMYIYHKQLNSVYLNEAFLCMFMFAMLISLILIWILVLLELYYRFETLCVFYNNFNV